MTEHDRARRWRENLGFTLEDLAERTGYSRSAISCLERGYTQRPDGKSGKTSPWVWLRYKLCCAAVAAEIKGKRFDW